MSTLQNILNDIDNRNRAFLNENMSRTIKIMQEAQQYLAKFEADLEYYKKVGKFPISDQKPTVEIDNGEDRRDSLKENHEPENSNVPPPKQSLRPRRNAALKANINISQISSMQSKEYKQKSPEAFVKLERTSVVPTAQTKSQPVDIKPNIVKTEEMPAPTRLPPRRKKNIKKENVSESSVNGDDEIGEEKRNRRARKKTTMVLESGKALVRSSDVIIQAAPIEIVVIENSFTEEQSSNEQHQQSKRTESKSPDDEILKKKSKSGSSQCDDSLPTDYEDAVSDSEENKNPTSSKQHNLIMASDVTYVASPNPPSNATYIASGHSQHTVADDVTFVVKETNAPQNIGEDDDTQKDTNMISKGKITKQIFNPFLSSPVKKKVEAFEKLNMENNAFPTRSTRTKTRALAKEQEQQQDNIEISEQLQSYNIKENTKFLTPSTSKVVPVKANTNTRINKPYPLNVSTDSMFLTKAKSTLKSSQAEYRERERIRKEKEAESARKRDALMQAQMAERRRKREEKQQKAQQLREQQEREKLKQIEAQRLKDEKHKALLQEQEEKKQKQREENEKKRNQAKKKAVEEKKREELKRIEEEKQVEYMKKKALDEKKKHEIQLLEKIKEAEERDAKLASQDDIVEKLVQKQKQQQRSRRIKAKYMTELMPLLPTEDCYDSDDENAEKSKMEQPKWTRSDELNRMQRCMLIAGESLKNTFFCRQAQSADLIDIFGNVDPAKLKRTSSAVWKKPPRYTLMPQFLK